MKNRRMLQLGLVTVVLGMSLHFNAFALINASR